MIELSQFLPIGSRGELIIQDGPTLPVRCVWWADHKCGFTFDTIIDLKWLAAMANQRANAA